MSQEETIKFWLRSALDDLKTAKAMLSARRYNYAMFMCQQALEELLKAAIVYETSSPAPFLHDLVLLSRKINLKIPLHILNNLRDITRITLSPATNCSGLTQKYIISRLPREQLSPQRELSNGSAQKRR
jgi:HEPN domain-containing protein